jgi:hypothetical protein
MWQTPHNFGAAAAGAAVQDAVLRGGKALPLYGRLLEAPHMPQAIVLQVCLPTVALLSREDSEYRTAVSIALLCAAVQCCAVQCSATHPSMQYAAAQRRRVPFRFAVCTATTLCLLLCCFLQAQGSGSSQTPSQLRSGDMLWSTFLAGAAAGSSNARPLPHIVDAAAPSTILFSSGTTVGSQWR